jgi:Protein of unknown function (DUF1203).
MFRIQPLSMVPFQPLFAQTDAQLRSRHARRVVADSPDGYPCRVSLINARPGETLLLLPWEHQGNDTPYRASGPVFVRKNAQPADPRKGEIPAMLRGRSLSVRAYGREHLLVDARLCAGTQLEAAIATLFADAGVDYLHVHSSGYGCYLCEVVRA